MEEKIPKTKEEETKEEEDEVLVIIKDSLSDYKSDPIFNKKPVKLNSTAPKPKIPKFQTEEQYLAEYDLKSELMAIKYFGSKNIFNFESIGNLVDNLKIELYNYLEINRNYFNENEKKSNNEFLRDWKNKRYADVKYFVNEIIKEVKQKQKEEYEKPLTTEEVENILLKHKNIFIKREGMEIFIKILVDYKFKSSDDKFYLQTNKKQSILTIISIFEFLYNKNFVGDFYKKLDKGKKKVDSEDKNLYRRNWKNITKLFKYDSQYNFKTDEFNNYYQLYSDNQIFYCEILANIEKNY